MSFCLLEKLLSTLFAEATSLTVHGNSDCNGGFHFQIKTFCSDCSGREIRWAFIFDVFVI